MVYQATPSWDDRDVRRLSNPTHAVSILGVRAVVCREP